MEKSGPYSYFWLWHFVNIEIYSRLYLCLRSNKVFRLWLSVAEVHCRSVCFASEQTEFRIFLRMSTHGDKIVKVAFMCSSFI